MTSQSTASSRSALLAPGEARENMNRLFPSDSCSGMESQTETILDTHLLGAYLAKSLA